LNPKNPYVKSYTRQYKLNEKDSNEVHNQIINLHKQGLIEKTTDCSFNSPLFLVRKKNGESRMVVDLRKINAILKPLIVALPKIDEILGQLVASDPNYISCTDFFKGYWSIKLHPKTRHYTSFTDPKTGISYQYSVLPMGLNVSAAAFVLALGRVFQDKEYYHFLYTYVDNACIVSKTVEDHLKHLQIIFQTERANNLRLNPTKTNLAFHEIEFLGFTMSNQGISISPTKTDAIKRIATPSSRKSLQKILGLV